MSDPFFTNSNFPDPSPTESVHRRAEPLPAAEQAKIQLLLDTAERENKKHRAGPAKFKKTLKYMFISWSTIGSFEILGVPYAGYGSLIIGFLYGITRSVDHVG